jgi:hypothetical protein
MSQLNFSHSVGKDISLMETDSTDNLHDLLQLPLSDTAYHQFLPLNLEIDNLILSEEKDV